MSNSTLLRTGVAADTAVNGDHTGFFSLTVRSPDRPGPMASSGLVETGVYTGDISADQQLSVDTGWATSCATWSHFGVFGLDQALACATSTQRPELSYASLSQGASGMLRDTLMFVDHHFDINGDVVVAATGAVDSDMFDPTASPRVGEIGSVPEKALAAVAARVDLLVVPPANFKEFSSQQALVDAGIEVVSVFSVTQAVRVVCERSLTEVCVTRVLADR